jgi:transposase
MYFRLKKNSCGQVLQLVEAYRNALAKPCHRIVISLGNAAINEEDRKTIANMVERQLYGYTELLEQKHSQHIQNWVSTIVRRVDKDGKWRPLSKITPDNPASKDKSVPADEQIIDGVIAEQVGHTNTAQLGPQLIALHAWNELAMPNRLEQLGFNPAQQQAAAVTVISRLTDPQHEYRLGEWFEQTGLPELFGQSSLEGVQSDDRYYRVSDRLLANKQKIEQHLQKRQQEIYELDRTILLYDLTNTHFEGEEAQNPKAKRGHNKQKRDDCLQITVGIVFDRNGFALTHKIFEGNKHDSKTLADMIGELEGVLDKATLFGAEQKPLVIVDAGIATRKNLTLLHEKGFSYLVNDSRRGRKQYAAQFKDGEFVVVENRETKEPVLIRSLEETYTPPDSNATDAKDVSYTERVLLCKSQARGEKETAILSHAEQKFLDEVKKLAMRVTKGKLLDEEKILRSIGKIQGRHPRVQRYYTFDVSLPSGKEGIAKSAVSSIKVQRKDDLYDATNSLAGCYVLRTDRKELNDQQIWHMYMTLTKAEDGFRALKSHLGLRPNPHHKEDRIDGHVFISVLAYHLLRFITFGLEKKGDWRNWESIRRVLQTHCYTTIILPTKSGAVYRIRKAGDPEECQKSIYTSIEVIWRNLPVIRQVVHQKTKSTL